MIAAAIGIVINMAFLKKEELLEMIRTRHVELEANGLLCLQVVLRPCYPTFGAGHPEQYLPHQSQPFWRFEDRALAQVVAIVRRGNQLAGLVVRDAPHSIHAAVMMKTLIWYVT